MTRAWELIERLHATLEIREIRIQYRVSDLDGGDRRGRGRIARILQKEAQALDCVYLEIGAFESSPWKE